MNKKFIVYIIFIFSFSSLFAQLKQANVYYNNFEYSYAIPYYKKEADKKNKNLEAIEKLAFCYFKTKNYQQAENYYAQLINLYNTTIDPVNFYYYGLVLKNNGKVDEAKQQFKTYLSKVPHDKQAQVALRSCDDIKVWVLNMKQFKVSSIDKINSQYSDFSPVFYNDQLIFVSERTKDMVNYSQNGWNNNAFLNIYKSPIKKINDSIVFRDKAQSYKYPVNSQYHDGPVCFNADQTLMIITRASKILSNDTNVVSHPQLFFLNKKGSSWGKAIPFEHNNIAYSIAHPSISADGKYLYFSSDMPGGKGGMDIYVCEKNGESWGLPKNVGEEVNTLGNENFHVYCSYGVLFFSSDGHSGFGGLDVFSSTNINGKFSDVKNLGVPLNSSTDDFGIIFYPDNNKGYFSSDRPGGKGSDDIYSFDVLNNYTVVQGRILYNKNINDPVKNSEVLLLTEDGKVVKVATTDINGFFKFENLDPDKKYMVRMDADEPQFAGKKKLYMTDEKDNLVRITLDDNKGNKFTIKNLPIDKNQLSQLGINDDINLAGNILVGENPAKPLENSKISLINARNMVVQTTTTNALGAFVFTDLPFDENFTVRIDETETRLQSGTKITITNKEGKEVQTLLVDANGKFKFLILAEDKNKLSTMHVDDPLLKINVKGKLMSDKQNPLSNSKVNLLNNNGQVITSTKTDVNGSFEFNGIDFSQNYIISIDENDSILKAIEKLYLVGENGKIIRSFASANGSLRFIILPEDKNRMGYIYVDDPWLKVINLKNQKNNEELTIIENIYYKYDDYAILPEAKLVLEKVVNIMAKDPNVIIELSSHTDSRSTADYNIKLSQKRAAAAVAYMISKGVNKNRISGKGYGESKLINKCADGVECSEEEHAKNRRTEFNIKRK